MVGVNFSYNLKAERQNTKLLRDSSPTIGGESGNSFLYPLSPDVLTEEIYIFSNKVHANAFF